MTNQMDHLIISLFSGNPRDRSGIPFGRWEIIKGKVYSFWLSFEIVTTPINALFTRPHEFWQSTRDSGNAFHFLCYYSSNTATDCSVLGFESFWHRRLLCRRCYYYLSGDACFYKFGLVAWRRLWPMLTYLRCSLWNWKTGPSEQYRHRGGRKGL
jgi:hypothetical protein